MVSQIHKLQVEEEQPSISHVSGYQIHDVESKPTVGPWEVYDYKEAHYSRVIGIRGGDGISICKLDGGGSTHPITLARVRADAKLIASAPDLLAAAKAALKYVDNLDGQPVDQNCKDCTGRVFFPKGTPEPPLCWIHQLEKAVKEAS